MKEAAVQTCPEARAPGRNLCLFMDAHVSTKSKHNQATFIVYWENREPQFISYYKQEYLTRAGAAYAYACTCIITHAQKLLCVNDGTYMYIFSLHVHTCIILYSHYMQKSGPCAIVILTTTIQTQTYSWRVLQWDKTCTEIHE